ncbi:MAG: hypothetical protein Q9221_006410 [Calogaya cf. arnoldii]
MGRWVTFEAEVRRNTEGVTWPNRTLMWRANNSTDREHVRCANETGVVGRFQQHIGHVMTCVGEDLAPPMYVYFGDWCYGGAGTVPDLTIWSADAMPEPLVVGEVKTPWTLNLDNIMVYEGNRDLPLLTRFMRSAGQVAEYMKRFGLKYGFLTTYEKTIFFKQEIMESNNELASCNQISTRTNILWYSNPIHHDVDSADDSRNPQTYQGRVSLRECMLYLMRLARTTDSKHYPDDGKPWTTSAIEWNQRTYPKSLKYPYKSFKGNHATSSSTSQSSSSKGKGRQKQSYTRGTDLGTADLEDRMSSLSLEKARMEKAQILNLPPCKVRWDGKTRNYF